METMECEAMKETLREWWWAWRWVVKNFREALKLRDPRSSSYSRKIGWFTLIALLGLIPAIVVAMNLPFPLTFLVLLYIPLLITVILADLKLDLDWFNQHYEIREKQREADK